MKIKLVLKFTLFVFCGTSLTDLLCFHLFLFYFLLKETIISVQCRLVEFCALCESWFEAALVNKNMSIRLKQIPIYVLFRSYVYIFTIILPFSCFS